jgi:tetratricopeptide (TPR) repeat protein
MHDRSDSPWYPSATLIRQQQIGDWTETIEQVNQKLIIKEDIDCKRKSLSPQAYQQNYSIPEDKEALLACYQQAINVGTENAETLLNIGIALTAKDCPEDALNCYRKALLLAPENVEIYCNQAIAFNKTNQLNNAVDAYQKALALKPDYAPAHNNLGNLLAKQSRLEEALGCYERAVALDPYYAKAHCNCGNVLAALDRPEQAIAYYQKAIALQSDYAEAHNNLGNLYSLLEQFDMAINSYKKAIFFNPQYAEAHFNLGIACNASGQPEKAIPCFKNTLAIHPGYRDAYSHLCRTLCASGKMDETIFYHQEWLGSERDNFEIHNSLGSAYSTAGRFDEAIASYQVALTLKPDYAEALNNLGGVYSALKRFDEAIICHNQALAIIPDAADTYYNLGVALYGLQLFDEAIATYQKVILLKPDHLQAYNNLGAIFCRLNHPREAIECFNHALSLSPGTYETYNNLGASYNMLNDFDNAIHYYSLAVPINPEKMEVTWGRSLVFLMLGRFKEGWEDHEKRWECKEIVAPIQELPYPRWLGERSITGSKLLIQSEQGLGDSIQMVRYINLLEKQGIQCFIDMHDPLVTLIARSFPNAKINNKGLYPEGMDYHIPLMSLPLAMKTHSVADIPHEVPYLVPDYDRVMFWKETLNSSLEMKVGLVWRGNPDHKNDHNRSIKLDDILPILTVNQSVQFVTLQKNLTLEERTTLKAFRNVRILDEDLTDFDESAAIMTNLDLVISVDSAPAHLAGALGVPVWILLWFGGEWRWMHDRSDSPWYPSATLIRQQQIGDWTEVILNVNERLADEKIVHGCE